VARRYGPALVRMGDRIVGAQFGAKN
jgi:hypothetical protein